MPNGLGPQYNASGMRGTLTGSMIAPTQPLPSTPQFSMNNLGGGMLPPTSPGTFFPGVSSPQLQGPGQRPGQGPKSGAIRPELFPTLGPNIGEVQQRIPGLAIPTLGGAAPAPEQGRLGQLFSNPQFLQGLLQLGGVLGGGRYAGAAVQGVQTAFERQRQLDIERERMERERREEEREARRLELEEEAAGERKILTQKQTRLTNIQIAAAIKQGDDARVNGQLDGLLQQIGTEEDLDQLTPGNFAEKLGVRPKNAQYILDEGLFDAAIERRRAEIVEKSVRGEEAAIREFQRKAAKLDMELKQAAKEDLKKFATIYVEGTAIGELGLYADQITVDETGRKVLKIPYSELPQMESLLDIEAKLQGIRDKGKYTFEDAEKSVEPILLAQVKERIVAGNPMPPEEIETLRKNLIAGAMKIRRVLVEGDGLGDYGGGRGAEIQQILRGVQTMSPEARDRFLTEQEGLGLLNSDEVFYIKTQMVGPTTRQPADFIAGGRPVPREPALPVKGKFSGPSFSEADRRRLALESIEEARLKGLPE